MIKLIKKWFNLNFYISQLDKFLSEFDKKHPRLSASQRAEKEKYARIFKYRDQPEVEKPRKTFWSSF